MDVLVGIGNPLLDISAIVPQAILDRYEIKAGNAILAEEKHLPLYEELKKNYQVEYIAGGAAQNSIRCAQWMLQSPKATAYIGCVGDDADGKTLREAAEKEGVDVRYLVTKEKPTGTCAVCVIDNERSLVANIGAAESYKQSHFESQEIQELLGRSKVLYCTGFFLTHSPQVLELMGKFAAEHDKTFVMNLSAPFLIDFFWDPMSKVLPYADYICCNEDEAAVLGKKQSWGSDLKEIAAKLADLPKVNKNKKRTIIFTQGAKPTLVYRDGNIKEYQPIEVPKSEIVDTNGAGDAFVGGFLSQLVQDKPIDQCIAAGHYTAWECIRRPGCTFPPKPNFKYP